MLEFDFNKSYKFQMIALKLIQCHPDGEFNKYSVLKILVALGPYTIYFWFLCNSIGYNVGTNDHFNIFKNIVPCTYYICTTIYIMLLIKNRSTFSNLMKCVTTDYAKAQHMDERQKEIIERNKTKGINVSKFFCILMIGSTVNFGMKSVVLSTYNSIKNRELKLIPFYEMHYPWNWTEQREYNYYIFSVTYVGEMYFTAMASHIYFCISPLGPIFILHACGQLDLIKIKFENIFENDNVDENFNDIVKELQYVYSFVKAINTCFTVIYEVILKQIILLIPFTSYAMILSLSQGEVTIEYTTIILQTLITSFVPCYYGELLMQKSEEMRLAAYSCGWERVFKPNARKTLLIILTRALRPIAIKSIFFTINLDTLTDVFRQAYAIFNVLTAML